MTLKTPNSIDEATWFSIAASDGLFNSRSNYPAFNDGFAQNEEFLLPTGTVNSSQT